MNQATDNWKYHSVGVLLDCNMRMPNNQKCPDTIAVFFSAQIPCQPKRHVDLILSESPRKTNCNGNIHNWKYSPRIINWPGMYLSFPLP